MIFLFFILNFQSCFGIGFNQLQENENLIYQSVDTTYSLNENDDSVNLFLLGQSMPQRILDSICSSRKISDSLSYVKLLEVKNGYLDRNEYLNYIFNFQQPCYRLEMNSMWYIGFDTIKINNALFEIYKFDISYEQNYNEHSCYHFTYIKNLFITIFTSPVQTENIKEDSYRFNKFHLISAPNMDSLTLSKFNVKSENILDGETWINRNVYKIMSK